jgi:hypothetical protein
MIKFNILDSRMYILSGTHAPCNHIIGEETTLQLGTQIEGWNLNGTFLHLEICIQLCQWGDRIMMQTYNVIHIYQNVSLV